MPRIARVIVPDVPYHITQRGNYRQDVFENEEDKAVYLKYFQEYRKKHKLKVYAWVLMDNHVHFIVEPTDEISIAKVFNATHMRYSQYFNKKKGAFGHLWQGRFFSCPLDKEHLYEAIRYVELNPIRANLASDLTTYVFCSSRRLIKESLIPLNNVAKYLEIDDWEVYLKGEENEELIQNIRANTKTGRPAGNTKFITKIEQKTGRNLIAQKRGRPKKA